MNYNKSQPNTWFWMLSWLCIKISMCQNVTNVFVHSSRKWILYGHIVFTLSSIQVVLFQYCAWGTNYDITVYWGWINCRANGWIWVTIGTTCTIGRLAFNISNNNQHNNRNKHLEMKHCGKHCKAFYKGLIFYQTLTRLEIHQIGWY